MISENKVIIDMDQKGIEITCKHCEESQTYTMRSKKIPERPKTQCQNCEKWIYIDKSLLVKKDQNEVDQRPNDQKNDKQSPKPIEKPKKPEIKQLSPLTKNDQMTKSKKGNREHQEVRFYEQMSQEIELFGRTIPLDKVREIARETLLGHRVMMKGVKSWLGVWKKRYHEYIEDKPEHFLIDKYEKAQETLEFLYKVEKLFKEITNGKS
jgi:hypothetical protein